MSFVFSARSRTVKIASAILLLGMGSLVFSQRSPKAAKEAARDAIHAFFPKEKAAASGPVLLANLADSRINESSGLAESRRNPGVYWTQNDSGGGPYLFAINRKGQTLARYEIAGTINVDWEDISVGPGAGGRPAIYIGDIGDNNAVRKDTALYRIGEPLVDANHTLRESRLSGAEKFPYHYPDGSHDAETLLVNHKSGAVYIVTKSGTGTSGVYAFPLPLRANQTVILQKVGILHFTNTYFSGNGRYAQGERQATGGDISPDGSRVIIRTYTAAYEWQIAPGQSLPDALKAKPKQWLLPLTKQGESLCFRADGKAVLTTSEQLPTPLYEIPIIVRH